MRMETVEHFARISLVTQLLGGPNLLSREEVEKLGEARALLRRHGAEGRDRFWVSREELEALIDEAVKSAKVRS
jgi:hypothetical protein